MTPPPPPSPVSPAATARILYASLAVSAGALTGLAWFFRGSFALPDGTGGAVTFAAYALAASGLLAGLAFRRLIPERALSQDADVVVARAPPEGRGRLGHRRGDQCSSGRWSWPSAGRTSLRSPWSSPDSAC